MGRRYSAFKKTGCLTGCLHMEGQRGRESTGLLLLCFLVIRGLPFHHRAIWKINVQHDDNGSCPRSGTARSKSWQCVRVETSGCTSEAREVKWVRERTYRRGSVCTHCQHGDLRPEEPGHAHRDRCGSAGRGPLCSLPTGRA